MTRGSNNPSPCMFQMSSLLFYRASDKCQKEKRKTINGDDLLSALATLGFEDYIEPLKVYLTRYREVNAILLHVLNGFCDWFLI